MVTKRRLPSIREVLLFAKYPYILRSYDLIINSFLQKSRRNFSSFFVASKQQEEITFLEK